MLLLQGVTYAHPNKDILFSELSLAVNRHDKIALTGNNGVGKSTLLQLMAGQLQPVAGTIHRSVLPYYVPQLYGKTGDTTIAEALGVNEKRRALQCILAGDGTERDFEALADDWTIEERCTEALHRWGLSDLELSKLMAALSGGQRTRLLLAGIHVHRPGIVLLDEPSNHLDTAARAALYDYIRTTADTLVVVSHDRMLLNLLHTVAELGSGGLTLYGGNYDFYDEQKRLEREALAHDVKHAEKALRKARETERAAVERQQKLNDRGRRKQEKAGMPTIVQHALRDAAEKSTSRLKGVHTGKIDTLAGELGQLRARRHGTETMKLDLDDARLHHGKLLVTAANVQVRIGGRELWPEPLSFTITSGERMAIEGPNGSGKTTCIRLLLGEIAPSAGTITRAPAGTVYIDQDYSLIDDRLSVYEQAQLFNTGALPEHAVKTRLNRFLFPQAAWDKSCKALSGGEKLRLLLCCIAIGNQAPELIVLDEPTNNLDLQNVAILTAALNEYTGTLIVVSHDTVFLEEIGIGKKLAMSW